MKKLKLFLIGLSLMAFSSFAFAMEQNPTKEVKEETKNEDYEDEDENEENNTILIVQNDVQNFDLTEKEKNNIKNFIFNGYDVSDNTKENLISDIKQELEFFLKEQLNFEENEDSYGGTFFKVLDDEKNPIGSIMLRFRARKDTEFNSVNNLEKRALCLITIDSAIADKEELNKRQGIFDLNIKFVKKLKDEENEINFNNDNKENNSALSKKRKRP